MSDHDALLATIEVDLIVFFALANDFSIDLDTESKIATLYRLTDILKEVAQTRRILQDHHP